MTVTGFTFNAFAENTYLLSDDTNQCVVVDPGCYERHEQEALQHFIDDHGLRVVLLINTHCHIDHVLGNAFVLDTYKIPFLIHEDDLSTLRSVTAYAPNYGFHQYQPAEPTGFLQPGTPLTFGDTSLEVLFTPGHAPGHVVLYNAADKLVIGGDVLFQNSIGRTDLPGGNYPQLINSIHEQLLTLPDDVTVYPGHGPTTTIGAERLDNPFLRSPPSYGKF